MRLSTFGIVVVALLFMGQGCLSIGENQPTTSGPGGMFVSTSKGDSWTMINSEPLAEGVEQLTGVSVYRLVEDPQDEKALYWGSREKGLYYSYDEGKSWKHALAPLDTGFIRSIAVHPKETCVIYVTNGRQLFKTTDCARSFDQIYEEVRIKDSITDLAVDPFDEHHLYMSLTNGDVLKSENDGKTWAVVRRFKNSYVADIAFDGKRDGAFYVATREKGLFRSYDRGANWTDLTPKLEDFTGALTFSRLLVYPSQANYLYWVSDYGILVSRNAGEDWEAINLLTPPGTVDIYGFAVNKQNPKEMYYTGTIELRSNFYRTVDGGKTWETRKLPSKQVPTQLRVHPKNTDWVYMGFTIPPEN